MKQETNDDTLKTAEIDTNTLEKTKLYIGLETKDGLPIAPEEVIQEIESRVDAGTFTASKGMWNGELENSIVFECMNLQDQIKDHLKQDGYTVKDLKNDLELEFDQESVMVEQSMVEVAF